MTAHLIKLCVGVDSIDDLATWIAWKQKEKQRLDQPEEQIHTTRVMPKRRDSLLAGGSLYWVIKGGIQARQQLVDLRAVTGADGISRCQIVMSPELVTTEFMPRRPFQGWRYLEARDAPKDIAAARIDDDIPAEMRRDLVELGLL